MVVKVELVVAVNVESNGFVTSVGLKDEFAGASKATLAEASNVVLDTALKVELAGASKV